MASGGGGIEETPSIRKIMSKDGVTLSLSREGTTLFTRTEPKLHQKERPFIRLPFQRKKNRKRVTYFVFLCSPTAK
jgi:shikimate kinase